MGNGRNSEYIESGTKVFSDTCLHNALWQLLTMYSGRLVAPFQISFINFVSIKTLENIKEDYYCKVL